MIELTKPLTCIPSKSQYYERQLEGEEREGMWQNIDSYLIYWCKESMEFFILYV